MMNNNKTENINIINAYLIDLDKLKLYYYLTLFWKYRTNMYHI